MIKCTQMVRPRDFCLWRPLLVDCAHERLLEPWDFLAQNIFGHRSASSGKHKNENDIQEIMNMIMIIMTKNDNDSLLAIIVTIVLVCIRSNGSNSSSRNTLEVTVMPSKVWQLLGRVVLEANLFCPPPKKAAKSFGRVWGKNVCNRWQ